MSVSEAPTMPNPRDIIGGRYQIIKELGSGGFGKTYLVEDLESSNYFRCVVKQLQPKFNNQWVWQQAKERFATEAMVLQRLGNHDQIPRLLAHFEEKGEFYLVQEFIDGEELKQEVSRKRLSEPEVIAFLEDVLIVLDFVHRQGVIHRDIKPCNLIRRRCDGKTVLIDFGAVKEIGTLAFDVQTQSIMTSVIIGTPGYMASEQRQGKPVYSSDIYSLGMTAIYALTGRTPMELEDPQTGELQNWQKLVLVSQKLADILDKMVRPKFAERYRCAADVLHDLRSLLKIGQTVGRCYEITRYLGGGIWSDTYLAENYRRPYQSPCVIKQLKPHGSNLSTLQEAEHRFETELKVLERLGDHNQIPKLWDYFEDKGEFYLVQEFINGEDLCREIQEGKGLSEEKVIALLEDVLEILDFIHKHNIIHRDIKPSNLIKRRSDDKIVLIDFGIVKEIVNLSADGMKSSSSTQAVGTEGYMPPEQMAGRPIFGSDIYALGMTAIQALTGVSPDQFQTNPQTGELIWREGTQISPRLVKILDKMVRLDIGKRYQTANRVLIELKKLKKRFKRPLTKTSLLKRGLVFAILALAGGAVFLLPKIFSAAKAIQLYSQGNQLIDSGQYKEAIAAFDAAIKSHPNFPQAWTNRGFALGKLGQHLEKFYSCARATHIQPDFPEAWNCRGLARFDLKQYEKAIEEYDQAIAVDENFYRAWYNKGEALIPLGRYEEAVAATQKVLDLEPDYFLAWTQMCRALYKGQRYLEARDACEQSFKIKPDYPPTLKLREGLQQKLEKQP